MPGKLGAALGGASAEGAAHPGQKHSEREAGTLVGFEPEPDM